MNKFVKTFQKLTALCFFLSLIQAPAFASRVGVWHRDGCNTGIYSGCIRFPEAQNVATYPNNAVTSDIYQFPRDNPKKGINTINMTKLINALGKKEIAMTDYAITANGGSGGISQCFEGAFRLDSSIWTRVNTSRGIAFQLKSFPYLGFLFKIKTNIGGPSGRLPANNFFRGWHNVEGYELTFPTGCAFGYDVTIQPVMSIEPIDVRDQAPSDFNFPTGGDFSLNLEHSFFGAFSLNGRDSRDTSGFRPRVTEDSGATINGKNVTLRISAATCWTEAGWHETRDFGTIKNKDVGLKDITASDVTIKVNCGANRNIEPWIVFTDDNNLNNRTSILTMKYTGDPSKGVNVGVKLKKQDNTYVSFGPDSSKINTQNQFRLVYDGLNKYSVTLTPQLVKLNSTQKVDGGQLEGLATYTLSYQ